MSTETKVSDGAESVAGALGRITESELGGDAKTAAFVGALMSENYRQYAATTQTLLDNLQQENERFGPSRSPPVPKGRSVEPHSLPLVRF